VQDADGDPGRRCVSVQGQRQHGEPERDDQVRRRAGDERHLGAGAGDRGGRAGDRIGDRGRRRGAQAQRGGQVHQIGHHALIVEPGDDRPRTGRAEQSGGGQPARGRQGEAEDEGRLAPGDADRAAADPEAEPGELGEGDQQHGDTDRTSRGKRHDLGPGQWNDHAEHGDGHGRSNDDSSKDPTGFRS
jgi:hypothetical protein